MRVHTHVYADAFSYDIRLNRCVSHTTNTLPTWGNASATHKRQFPRQMHGGGWVVDVNNARRRFLQAVLRRGGSIATPKWHTVHNLSGVSHPRCRLRREYSRETCFTASLRVPHVHPISSTLLPIKCIVFDERKKTRETVQCQQETRRYSRVLLFERIYNGF